MRVCDNKVGAVDLDKVVMVTNNVERKIDSHFSREELLYQEQRRSVKSKNWTLKSANMERWQSGLLHLS